MKVWFSLHALGLGVLFDIPLCIPGRRLQGCRSRVAKAPRRASGNAGRSPLRHLGRGLWKRGNGKTGGKAEGWRKGGHRTTPKCRKNARTAKWWATRSKEVRRSTRPGTAATRTWRATRWNRRRRSSRCACTRGCPVPGTSGATATWRSHAPRRAPRRPKARPGSARQRPAGLCRRTRSGPTPPRGLRKPGRRARSS